MPEPTPIMVIVGDLTDALQEFGEAATPAEAAARARRLAVVAQRLHLAALRLADRIERAPSTPPAG